MEDISGIVGSEVKREAFFDSIVAVVKTHFPNAEGPLIQRTIDSVIGNMAKCEIDLGPSAPTHVDTGKLEQWTNQWHLERFKSKRACNIDMQDVHNHNARL